MTDTPEKTCPLGEDCDLTAAYMAGQHDARKQPVTLEQALQEMQAHNRALSAKLEALEAENLTLRQANEGLGFAALAATERAEAAEAERDAALEKGVSDDRF